MNNINNNNNNNASTSNNTNNTINPNVTIPRDKYEELIKEFQKLQSQNSVLKRAVVDEQRKNKALNLELDRKTTQLEQKTEETDRLGYNNLRLEKRLTQLMFDLEEMERNVANKRKQQQSFSQQHQNVQNVQNQNLNNNNSNSSGSTPTSSSSQSTISTSSFFGSFLLGSSGGGSAQNVVDKNVDRKNHHPNNNSPTTSTGVSVNAIEVEEMKKEIEVLREELMNKISENERVHIEIFELKSTHAQLMNQLKDQLNDANANLHQKDKKLEEWTQRVEELSKKHRLERESMQDVILSLRNQLKGVLEVQSDRESTLRRLNHELHHWKLVLQSKIAFNDTRFNHLNMLNVPVFDRRVILQRIEILDRNGALYRQLTKAFSGLYASVIQKIQLLSKSLSTCHSPTIKYVHQKIMSLNSSSASASSASSSSGNSGNNHHTMLDMNAMLHKFSEELWKGSEIVMNDVRQQLNPFEQHDITTVNVWDKKKQERQHLTIWMNLVKNWIRFHRDCLLYLVICIQDGDCYSMDPPATTAASPTTTPTTPTTMSPVMMMPSNNSNFSNGNNMMMYMKFQDVYMRMTPMTQAYKQLYDSTNQCIDCIDSNDDDDSDEDDENDDRNENSSSDHTKTTNLISCMQQIQDNLTSFLEVACTTIAQEQKVVFVSPMIKSANEKITKSLSVIVSVYSNMFKSFKSLYELNGSSRLVYSRGALCDYGASSSSSSRTANEFSLPGDDPLNDDRELYYRDNDSMLTAMQYRGQRYLSMLGRRQAQDVANFQNISLSEAIKNKQLVEKLKREVEELRSKVVTYEGQIDEYESIMDRMREEVRLFERRFYECFVNWNLSVQAKNMIELRFDESQWSHGSSQQHLQTYVDKVDAVLQKSLEVFDMKLKVLIEANQLLESRINDSLMLINSKNNVNVSNSKKNTSDGTLTANSEQLVVDHSSLTEHGEAVNSDEQDVQPEGTSSVDLSHDDSQKPPYMSKSNKCTVIARNMTPQEEKLFSPTDIHREQRLKDKFAQQIAHLMKQIDICDMKAVEYRLQWQHCVIELEEAVERENQLSLRLESTAQMLQMAQDDLRTHTVNYENQIHVLSENLAVLHHRLDIEEEAKNQSNSILSSLPFFTRTNNNE